MRPRDTFFSPEHHYSLGREEDSGRHYLSIPVSIRVIDYEELYGLSPEEFEHFSSEPPAAIAFARAARERRHDDRLLVRPGWNRGDPIEPPPPGTPPPPPRPPIRWRREDARSVRADAPPSNQWFGPSTPQDGLQLDPRIEAVAARARSGDLSGRDDLVALLHDTTIDVEARISAQRLLVLLARDRDFADSVTFDYLRTCEPSLREELNGLGKLMLARSSLPLLIEDAEDGLHVSTSVAMMVDTTPDERHERPDLAWMLRATQRTLARETATYLLKGTPWSPATIVDRMRPRPPSRTDHPSLYSNWFLAGDLAAWSGIPGPYLRDVELTAGDRERLQDWADALDALPWRPGHKYFHGHDVDGGPSLHS